MKDHAKGLLGLVGLAGLALAFFLLRRFFPSALALLLGLVGVAAVGVAALVALALVFAFRKPKQPGKAAGGGEQAALLQKGRGDLLTLRGLFLRTQNGQVRALGEGVCGEVEQILRALKDQPEDLPRVKKLFTYYLPTLGNILRQLVRLEQSGVPDADLTEKVISCLRDTQTVMEKLYATLFDDDKLKLAVEMEVLDQIGRREGLLADPFSLAEDGGQMGPALAEMEDAPDKNC